MAPSSMSTSHSILHTNVKVLVAWSQHRQAIGLRLEHVLWGLLLLASLWMRLIDLDVRAMSHDESLHALYSYYLHDRGEYVHKPMMHGPLLFHTNALIYMLLGISDFTARLLPALAGTLAVGSMWWYRRYLGVWGALLAGLLLSLSPSLLFHSRYIRNDIYIVLFTLIWVYSLLRYVESGQAKWMGGLCLGMVLGFISKENHFITGLILGLFCGGTAVVSRLLPRPLAQHDYRLWDVAIAMALLVLPFLAPVLHLVLGWDPLDTSTEGVMRSGILTGSLAAVSLICGGLWFSILRPRAWTTAFGGWAYVVTFLLFYLVIALFFSTFLTNLEGLLSGVVGSLGYWMSQQEVQRGSQPWYYYLVLTSLYEFLPFLLALLGSTLGLYSFGQWLRAGPDDHTRTSSGTPFMPLPFLLLLWWGIMSWIAYTYAGERMPWLLTHIVTPMCLLGGYGLDRIFHGFRSEQRQSWMTLLALTVGILGWIAAIPLLPFGGRDVEAIRQTWQWLVNAGGGTILVTWGVWYLMTKHQISERFSILVIGLCIPLLLITIRASYRLSFVNYDNAAESLTYAHGSPDVKQALTEIATLSQHLHDDKTITVSYDDDNSWPMAWYFREYPNAQLYREPNDDLTTKPVVLAGPNQREQVGPLLALSHAVRTYRLIWWPDEAYKQWSRASLADWLDPAARQRWKDIFFFRAYPHYDPRQWPHRREFNMYVRHDLAPLVWAESLDEVASTPRRLASGAFTRFEFPQRPSITGDFAGLPLTTPRSIKIASNGLRVLTDSGNHRVLVLDAENQLVLATGSFCSLDSDVNALCQDPDGDGPLEPGDGQFNEPWGAALSDTDLLFVSDTWNHRIQVLDLEGQFQTKWGQLGYLQPDLPAETIHFFGPRGVDMLPGDQVLVVDTGNKRLMVFREDGSLVQEVGGSGVDLGYFDEPVDIWVDQQTGHTLVTDNWNHRIQLLTRALDPLATIAIPSGMWNSQDALHKPYIATIPDFGIAVSDPANGQVVFFDVVGQPLGVIDLTAEATEAALPLGLAYDPQSAELLVVDSNNHKVWVFDLSQATELLRRST